MSKMRTLNLSITVLLSCAVLAACASGHPGANSQANSDPAGSAASTGPAQSQSGGPTSPSGGSPSPVGTAVPVSGRVGLSVLSLSGPFQPAGPYLGTSVQAILQQMSAALGGKQPSCPANGCWADAKVPAGSLLLAVRPGQTSCNQLHAVTVAKPTATAVRVDLQLANACRVGQGSAARAAAMLFALPRSALAPGTGTVQVRASALIGQPYQSIGSVHLS
jgi:hypothetical protein